MEFMEFKVEPANVPLTAKTLVSSLKGLRLAHKPSVCESL
jgi:hypothetical protein